MAWREVLPMDERVRFVLEVERGELSVAEICRLHGISRKTGYKWIARYHTEGLEGMRERSRRPLHCPHETSQEWQDRIIRVRLKHPRWGPKKIRVILEELGVPGAIPAVATIGNIISRAGLVKSRRRPRQANPRWREPLTEAKVPNHVWAVDYKGWFRTRDGQRCDPLTVSDLCSRYVLDVRGLPNQSYIWARKSFEELFRQYGLPEIIRSDNGGPFASTGAGRLSRLSVWWMSLGIQPELITPGHPEQNGIHERMHLTLKQEACHPPAANRRAQQRRFNQWRIQFNEQRPHEALGMKKPAERYRDSERRYPRRLVEPSYPEGYQVRRVRSNGEIKWCGRKRFLGTALKGVPVGVKRLEQGRSQVYVGPILIGDLHDADSEGLRPTVSLPQNLPGRT